MHRTTFAFALLAIGLGSASVAAQAPVALLERADPDRPRAERDIICRGAAIPDGWILVDDVRSADMCGGDNPAVLNLYNVWAIERYDVKPVGATMQVCANTPLPAGWVLEDVYRSKEHCGHPENPFQPNVKRIRRAR